VESERPACVAPASPETTFGYWERKNDEVALLREHLEIDGGPAIVTVPDLVREKQYLRAQMIARFIASHPHLTESWLYIFSSSGTTRFLSTHRSASA
jgi:hypothetical protein